MKGSIWKGKGALFLLLLLFLVTMSACSPRNPPGREGSQAVSASPSSSESSAPVEEKEDPQPSTISLVAVGDNLIHDAIYNQASRRAGGDGYDFSFAYEQVAPLIAGHDIAFYNQETPLASAIAPLSSYPMFNSPTQLGDHMLSLGFNVVTQANNHMLDQGEAGLVATMDYWDTTDALMIGAYRNEEAMNQPATITKNGITIAFVATTYGTNGLSLPTGSELRYILDTDLEEIQRQIQMARQSADFVVVAPHWGIENTFEPSAQQLELAQQMADWGADLIIGMHSHTIQPVAWLTAEDGRQTLVFYSMGNFISAMHGAYNIPSLLADLEITKDPATGETTITKAEVLPLVTHFDSGVANVAVWPLTTYTREMAARHGVTQFDSQFSYDYILECCRQVIDPQFWSPEMAAILEEDASSSQDAAA